MRSTKTVGWLVLVSVCLYPNVVAGQQVDHDTEAYYRAVSDHFRVSLDEALTLAQWGLPDDHVPVLLFMARRAGVSADALAAQKRGGRSWAQLADRYGVSPGSFYVPLDGAEGPVPVLETAYERFRATPRAEWDSLRLADEEIVGLVNLDFLSELLDVSPLHVLREVERAGSFRAAYSRLVRL